MAMRALTAILPVTTALAALVVEPAAAAEGGAVQFVCDKPSERYSINPDGSGTRMYPDREERAFPAGTFGKDGDLLYGGDILYSDLAFEVTEDGEDFAIEEGEDNTIYISYVEIDQSSGARSVFDLDLRERLAGNYGIPAEGALHAMPPAQQRELARRIVKEIILENPAILTEGDYTRNTGADRVNGIHLASKCKVVGPAEHSMPAISRTDARVFQEKNGPAQGNTIHLQCRTFYKRNKGQYLGGSTRYTVNPDGSGRFEHYEADGTLAAEWMMEQGRWGIEERVLYQGQIFYPTGSLPFSVSYSEIDRFSGLQETIVVNFNPAPAPGYGVPSEEALRVMSPVQERDLARQIIKGIMRENPALRYDGEYSRRSDASEEKGMRLIGECKAIPTPSRRF